MNQSYAMVLGMSCYGSEMFIGNKSKGSIDFYCNFGNFGADRVRNLNNKQCPCNSTRVDSAGISCEVAYMRKISQRIYLRSKACLIENRSVENDIHILLDLIGDRK